MVYLDETWCNVHDGKTKAWLEKDPTCRGGAIGRPKGYVLFPIILDLSGQLYSKPSRKGKRLIVLHAGGKDGWIPGKHYL